MVDGGGKPQCGERTVFETADAIEDVKDNDAVGGVVVFC